jgi:hypothetical protein
MRYAYDINGRKGKGFDGETGQQENSHGPGG